MKGMQLVQHLVPEMGMLKEDSMALQLEQMSVRQWVHQSMEQWDSQWEQWKL
jgi:hypothetical protein